MQVAAGLSAQMLPLERVVRVERANIGDTINIPHRSVPTATSGLAEATGLDAETVTYTAVQPSMAGVVERVLVSRQLWQSSNIDVKADIINTATQAVFTAITSDVCDLFDDFDTTAASGTMNVATFSGAIGVMVGAGVPRNELVAVLHPVSHQQLLKDAGSKNAFTNTDLGPDGPLPKILGVPIYETSEVNMSPGDTHYENFIGSRKRALAVGMWGSPWVDVQYKDDASRHFAIEVGVYAAAIELIDAAGGMLITTV